MVEAYRESLPDSYLLVLRDMTESGPEVSLARALHLAAHSGKPAVWVDCSLLERPSAEAVELLLSYHEALRQAGIVLPLAHVEEHVRQQLLPSDGTDAKLPIVPTLLDAAARPYLFKNAA
ncbi:hypothetical protein [Hymenobacter koreensis]|uniref:STAS domain-containing protein n=1 Tax=Hymenobacter koreensis TaxID=1084523 RepID=A0ABP8J6G7_9BACT